MKKEWQRPVVNTLGIENTAIYHNKAECRGYADKFYGLEVPCQHPGNETYISKGPLSQDSNYTTWYELHRDSCSQPTKPHNWDLHLSTIDES